MEPAAKGRPSATAQAFGKLVEARNGPLYAFALERLNLAAHQNFLDVGFGNGALLALAAAKISSGLVAGIEPSKEMVAGAKLRVRAKQLDLRTGSSSSLPWPDETFHKVAAIHSFQFWPDPKAGLEQVLRVLRPGAFFLLILRDLTHRTSTAKLANPMSGTEEEVGDTQLALGQAGFVHVTNEGRQGSSHVITATRPS